MPPKYDHSLYCFLPSSPERHFLLLFELPCSVGDNDLISTNYTIANILIIKEIKMSQGVPMPRPAGNLLRNCHIYRPIYQDFYFFVEYL